MEDHSRKIPSPCAYEKPMNWLSKTARDLRKGDKRLTVIDKIYNEKK